ncbi:MFS transporter [Vineibacter terrae]|uniref:MFS transporter n=1 Tax=Vineibacter terrae TaxID=2586908 RepID=UPI002E380D85|nr:MFS transporter [Vineibacter terrae]HEX2891424.1 MFS transporter [Vineibacter terrae]
MAEAIDVLRLAPMRPPRPPLRTAVLGIVAFLTVVDLFAAQAILPTLTRVYGTTPAAMSVAVNASTIGMAVAGLAVALFGRHIDRRSGTSLSLALLSIPTALLAVAPDLTVFTLLRIVQGMFMSTAFTLTLAYLGERYSAECSAGAFAAYITGNVASNLFGRLFSAALADHFGLASSFYIFALLNLAGAALAFVSLRRARMITPSSQPGSMQSWSAHLCNRRLQLGFAIGFLILFAFIGTFTYVNFVLAGPRFRVSMMSLGFVYMVFLPAIFTTPFVGHVAHRLGGRSTLSLGITLALVGTPLLLSGRLLAVLAGLALIGVGTFGAQAAATGHINRAATFDRGGASGLYLASYFAGGIVGTGILGSVFDRFGWNVCVAGIGLALIAILVLARGLDDERKAGQQEQLEGDGGTALSSDANG